MLYQLSQHQAVPGFLCKYLPACRTSEENYQRLSVLLSTEYLPIMKCLYQGNKPSELLQWQHNSCFVFLRPYYLECAGYSGMLQTGSTSLHLLGAVPADTICEMFTSNGASSRLSWTSVGLFGSLLTSMNFLHPPASDRPKKEMIYKYFFMVFAFL
jgi:hypothetical protein